ncbi:MAG: hypothetical protein WAO10_03475, partial [Candidatus Sulfotelmatobacter sp.]
ADASGFCWLRVVTEEKTQSTKIDTATGRVNIEVHPRCYFNQEVQELVCLRQATLRTARV